MVQPWPDGQAGIRVNFYSSPTNLQAYYHKQECGWGDLWEALMLPLYPAMTQDDLGRATKTLDKIPGFGTFLP